MKCEEAVSILMITCWIVKNLQQLDSSKRSVELSNVYYSKIPSLDAN